MESTKASSTQNTEVTALIDALKHALSSSDPAAPATRGHLKETAEKLSRALEIPGETVQRVAYYACSISNPTLPQNHLQSTPTITFNR